MAELAEYERLNRPRSVDYYLEALDRRNEARAGVAAVLGAELECDRPDAFHDGGHEHRHLGPRLAARRRRGHDDPGACRGARSAVRASATGGGSRSGLPRSATVGRRGDPRGLRPGDRPGNPARRPLPRPVDHGRGAAGRPDRRARPRARCARHRRWGAGGRRNPGRRGRELGVDAYAHPGPEVAAWSRGHGRALGRRPRAWIASGRPSAGYFSFAAYDSKGRRDPHPDARRFETSEFYRPAIAGFARAVSWLSMYVGLDYVHRRGPAAARSSGRGACAAIEGVELLTPPHQMATLVTFRIRGWDCRDGPGRAGRPNLRDRADDPAPSMPSGSASASSPPTTSWTDSSTASGCWRPMRPGSLPARRTLPILGSV